MLDLKLLLTGSQTGETTGTQQDKHQRKIRCSGRLKPIQVPLTLFPLTFMLCLSLSSPDPTEKVNLQVLSPAFIKEDDNVTLKCQADGNPPPTSFNFHIKVRMPFLWRPAPLDPPVEPVYQSIERLGSSMQSLKDLIILYKQYHICCFSLFFFLLFFFLPKM